MKSVKNVIIKHRGKTGVLSVEMLFDGDVPSGRYLVMVAPGYPPQKYVEPGESLIDAVENAALRCSAALANLADFEELPEVIDTDRPLDENEKSDGDILAEAISEALGSKLVNSG
jgi:hypothetical protein